MARQRTPDVMGEALGTETASKSSSKAAAVAAPPAPVAPVQPDRTARGRDAAVAGLISRYTIWASGVGLIPLPVIDGIALTGLQVKMLSRLATLYGVEFSETSGRAVVAALLSGAGVGSVGGSTLMRMFTGIPVAGWIAGLLVMPAVAGALTYAVGRVFAQHFESGGTFLDFDAEQFRATFQEEYRKGLALVRRRQDA